MSKIDTDKDHFDEMTEYLSLEARWFALDAMACAFHNNGYSLQGNTEDNDVLWLAESICQKLRGHHFAQLSEEGKKEFKEIARASIACLPGLAQRIAGRYIQMSKAIRTTERIAREQARQMQNELRERRSA